MSFRNKFMFKILKVLKLYCKFYTMFCEFYIKGIRDFCYFYSQRMEVILREEIN